ncbi:MAG TPA: hypothetical protein ENG09_04395 [Candidatus Syntrophoarchaeum butanivorans]|uniref:Uncharacterized protein n=1 Tax=Candidatus Syntropharchaeum butanivorans TaxID=1839936 RepID=A0A7C0X0M7_9EURY|nr:MAG: hypothetical protein CW694_06395 [Candidatus Syntrophoarchaeum sp. WYZ-LMO15]HDM36475.1 hypothetical protein [Candidatus Syntrophoarchaeum butanivorans]
MKDEFSFQDAITELLRDESLSISAIQRRLGERGFKEHRLVITGYLRALRDLGVLKEVEVPPSKIYSLALKEEEPEKGFYDLIKHEIEDLDADENLRMATAVLVVNTLFRRPCFRAELKRMGIKEVETRWVRRVDGRPYVSTIDPDKLVVPDGDPAYECDCELPPPPIEMVLKVLSGVLKEVLDLSGLYEKYPQMTLGSNL